MGGTQSGVGSLLPAQPLMPARRPKCACASVQQWRTLRLSGAGAGLERCHAVPVGVWTPQLHLTIRRNDAGTVIRLPLRSDCPLSLAFTPSQPPRHGPPISLHATAQPQKRAFPQMLYRNSSNFHHMRSRLIVTISWQIMIAGICCSVHAFPTRLSQPTSPASAGPAASPNDFLLLPVSTTQ
jgi:hypothetical protein